MRSPAVALGLAVIALGLAVIALGPVAEPGRAIEPVPASEPVAVPVLRVQAEPGVLAAHCCSVLQTLT